MSVAALSWLFVTAANMLPSEFSLLSTACLATPDNIFGFGLLPAIISLIPLTS